VGGMIFGAIAVGIRRLVSGADEPERHAPLLT